MQSKANKINACLLLTFSVYLRREKGCMHKVFHAVKQSGLARGPYIYKAAGFLLIVSLIISLLKTYI